MKIKGTTTDRTSCDCCGRTNLRKTVVLETQAGDIVHYGTQCAAQALARPAAEVRTAARKADADASAAAIAARRTETEKRDADWFGFCDRFGGVTETLKYFGGFDEARAAWRGARVGTAADTAPALPERETLEGCECGRCYDCPDGWHYGVDMPCGCTPDCALERVQ